MWFELWGAGPLSERKNFSMLPRDCSCDISVKSMTAFCPCLVVCLKSFRLISLTEGISEQPSICSIGWLLVLTLMRMRSEKEQVSKESYLRRKGAPGSGMELSPVSKEINNFF